MTLFAIMFAAVSLLLGYAYYDHRCRTAQKQATLNKAKPIAHAADGSCCLSKPTSYEGFSPVQETDSKKTAPPPTAKPVTRDDGKTATFQREYGQSKPRVQRAGYSAVDNGDVSNGLIEDVVEEVLEAAAEQMYPRALNGELILGVSHYDTRNEPLIQFTPELDAHLTETFNKTADAATETVQVAADTVTNWLETVQEEAAKISEAASSYVTPSAPPAPEPSYSPPPSYDPPARSYEPSPSYDSGSSYSSSSSSDSSSSSSSSSDYGSSGSSDW